ncbi:E3 ubiquitin-protein ligase TRIM37-like [Culex pipiens pallens]|uniref:E3 ubiquitin-protein ligase TRIM37-like n=1 Tax=Culex pipiens pallens TaxID=42434 RepID=UPI0019545E5F|nr:E3 ubiquitin-protein ligase TRIM37-like [Culex pipiens pallens]
MSLVPVPVCSGCGQVAAVSISCSTCCLLCCGTCFGLTSSDFGGEARLLSLLSVRVCSMCSEPVPLTAPEQVEASPAVVPDEGATDSTEVSEEVPTAPSSDPEQAPTPAISESEAPSTAADKGIVGKDDQVRVPEPVVVKRERCWIHGKDLKLFCLQCDECICGECFLDAGGHMRHQIDFVEAVYKEKRAETERKLAALDEKVKNLKQDVVQVVKNLEIVEVAERDVLGEIEAVCEEAKEGIARLTGQRKRVLKIQAELPAKKQKLNEVLTQMVEKLPPEEFFKQQPQVEKQCDEISQCIPVSTFQPVEFEDIGCELIPAYEMQTCTLVNFDRVCFGWPKHFTTDSDVLWNVFLHRKGDDLFIKVFTANEAAVQFPYKVLVVIPHADLQKTIQRKFTVCGDPKEQVIASYAALFKEGFVSPSNELVIKVGVRPANIITESRFLRQQYQSLKARVTTLEKQQNTMEKQMQSKFCIMHFNAFVSKTPKKTQEAQHSAAIIDRADRHWVLRVYPFETSLPDTNLKVFVVLRKGSRTKCRYFIELIHDNPQQSVLQTTESLFESIDAGYGWHCFVDRKKLMADAGFYPNGILRFRFGVQPIEK